MKTTLRTLALFFASSIVCLASEGWLTDWEAAKAKSKAENKPILMDIASSDTCVACIKLDREVFSQKAFKDFAAENLILMEVDFPEKKQQSEVLKKQNTELEKQYPNVGFPAVFLLDSEGKKLSEDLGDLKGGPDAYIAKLKELIANSKK